MAILTIGLAVALMAALTGLAVALMAAKRKNAELSKIKRELQVEQDNYELTVELLKKALEQETSIDAKLRAKILTKAGVLR